jgi:1-deoxy-D-xylulose-5-phosphate reductoisomerase
MDMTTRLAILGSTGSIGSQTLDVVRQLPERFSVVALAAGNNLDLLGEQVSEFRPSLISTSSTEHQLHYPDCECLNGDDGLTSVATHPDADMVVVATTGHSAIVPTIKALRAGKQVALANKEVIVCAGEILMAEADAAGIEIRPIDSEHSAIWQCLQSRGTSDDIHRITLTASGGALRDVPLEQLPDVTAEQALAHPNWVMGAKVTIDSATLMNKGLEVIEARWLFRTGFDRIDVAIHPQSLIHSMVTYVDGSTMAQLGIPDMRVPIQYALTAPERVAAPDRLLDPVQMGTLEFRAPDLQRFPALKLAYQAGRAGLTFPTVLSAVDEIAVDRFLAGEIRFGDITTLVDRTLDAHTPPESTLTLDAIGEADKWAREYANSLISQLR